MSNNIILKGFVVIIGLLLFAVPFVSAETCSFINITQGPQGIPGTNGTNGTNGVNGADGTSCNITVNYTFTLPAGSTATATNVGTVESALIDFGIPVGATGAAGTNGTAADLSSYLPLNGTSAMIGNLSMGGFYINDLITGLLGGSAVNKSYVDAAIAGVSNYNATYDAKADTNYNASYWTGTNYNASYWTGTNYNASYDGASNYNASYITVWNTSIAMDAEVSAANTSMKNYVDNAVSGVSNYNASYNNLIRTDYVYTGNGSYLLGSNSSIATTTYVGQVNTSMKNYVDALPISNYNASYWTGTNYNASYITSTYNATYDAKADTNYNASYWTGTNYNASYWTGTNYNASYDGASNYNASYNSLIRTDYVYTGNGSYLLGSNASIATTTYVGAVNTSMKNYVDSVASSYNASYINKDGSVAMTGNLSLGTKNINNLATPSVGTDAATKAYVDSLSSNYNASYWTGTNYNASYITSTYNATYDAKADTNYNASYWTGTNYNASYWTGTNYNASYEGASNYNASYVTLTNTSYFLVDGTRAMTANISMGNKYITGLISGNTASDAVNKSYVDTTASNYNASYWTGTNYNASYITSTYNATYDAKADTNYNASYWTGTNYNASYLALDGNGNLSLGTKNIINLATPSISTDAATKGYVDTANTSLKSYVDSGGLPYVASNNGTLVLTTNGSYLLGSNASVATTTYVGAVNTSMKNYVDSTNTSMKNYVDAGLPYVSLVNTSYVQTTNTSYVLTDGSRAFSGNVSMGSKYINSLITGTSGSDATNKSYVDSVASSYNASYVTGYNTTHVTNPVYGYLTLMAGSSMVTTTNPTTMYQMETTTNKNNAIAINFTDGGSEVGMWIIDFPADWNYSANVVFTPIWTAHAGTAAQTVHFDVFGKLFPDDAALDTALAAIGDSQDSYITSGDIHVGPATTGAAITSVGTGGNTAIIKVTRDSATDNLGGTAELIGLRIKYSRILA